MPIQVSRWHGGTIPEQASKRLISLFSFPCHVAPGEAEAECVMLQRKGIVDAVMTQDVDAIMFGSGLTLRDWSREGKSKGNGPPTHVSVFDLEKLKEISGGLDPEGMILVALLSGGDYDEDGVAGIGISLACEIARAGFGSDLLELVRNEDEQDIEEWRERLQHELQTNESGYFKMKRKTVSIPGDFPDRKILDYYMNPAVTEEGELKKLERRLAKAWAEEIDVQALREYTAALLDWQYKPGAWHFVRNMAPGLLADRLRRGAATSLVTSEKQITERRSHFVSGGISELRVTVVPAEVAAFDLDAEEDSPEYLEKMAAAEDVEEARGDNQGDDENVPRSDAKKRKTPPWLPWNPQKIWIPETVVELGAREHVERWNQIQWEIENDAKKFATRKCPKKKMETQNTKGIGGMQAGAMQKYVVAAKSMRRPIDLIEGSSSPASKSISDLLASVEESLLASPARPKANTKLRRRIRTPMKSKSTQSEQLGSPSMLKQFNSAKASQAAQFLQEPEPLSQKSLTKLMGAGCSTDNDPFEVPETVAEKHSRPSTSSSTVLVRPISKKSSKVHAKGTQPAFPAKTSSSSSHRDLGPISKDPLLAPPDDFSSNQNLLQDQSIGPSTSLKTTIDLVTTLAPIDQPEDILSHITQRTPKRRANKERAHDEIKSASPSPVRSKRPIQEFFKPYMKARIPEAARVHETSNRVGPALSAVPLELTTGLKTSLTLATHLGAIPRSSLPGTWKEVECELGSSSQIVPGDVSRRPRMSIIDLTAD